MTTFVRSAISPLAVFAVVSSFAQAQLPPKSWVDKDTGHRVWRLSDEPNSGGFYFNVNAYTPDHKSMIYTAPDGIHVLDMETHKARLLVPNPPAGNEAATDPSAVRGAGASRNPHALVAGSKTNSVFFTQQDPTTHAAAVYKADVYTGAIRKLTDLPPKIGIVSVNADETLAAGTYIEGDATGKEYGSNAPANPAPPGSRQPRCERRPGPALSARKQRPDDGAPPGRTPPARPLHHSPRARPQWREARRHEDAASLHRLG